MCGDGGSHCLGGLGGICSVVGGRRQHWGFVEDFYFHYLHDRRKWSLARVVSVFTLLAICRLQQSGWGEALYVGKHWWDTLERHYTRAELVELGINITALQGFNIHSKPRKVRGLQARKMFTYSGSLWWDGHGGSSLPSQASPAEKMPVFIFKERAPIAIVSLGVLAVTTAWLPRKSWGPPDTISGGVQHLLQPGFTSTAGWECSNTLVSCFYLIARVATHPVGWMRVGATCLTQWVRFSPTRKCLRVQSFVVGWAPISLLFQKRMHWLVCCRERVNAGGRPLLFEVWCC